MIKFYKSKNRGVIALLLVIMITTLTLVSSIILSITNTSDLLANYHFSESTSVNVDIDSCMDDALYRISSSSEVTGLYYINLGNTDCSYEIGATVSGIKFVTSTASTTSGIGSWSKTVVTAVNVSTSPISIESYKDSVDSFDSYVIAVCGDWVTDSGEACDDGNAVTETQTCGNNIWEHGTHCNADCTAEIVLTEVCDELNTYTEQCGDGIQQIGTYCNADCTAELALNESCDSNFTQQCSSAPGYYQGNYVDNVAECFEGKLAGVSCNSDCTDCFTNVSCGF